MKRIIITIILLIPFVVNAQKIKVSELPENSDGTGDYLIIIPSAAPSGYTTYKISYLNVVAQLTDSFPTFPVMRQEISDSIATVSGASVTEANVRSWIHDSIVVSEAYMISLMEVDTSYIRNLTADSIQGKGYSPITTADTIYYKDADGTVRTAVLSQVLALGGGAITSVFGRTGVVVAVSGDYDADEITETASNKILTSTERTKLTGIETSADVTDVTNVVNSLNGATLTAVTVATGDKVMIQDVDDSDNVKTVTAQSIADLASGGSGDSSFVYIETDSIKTLNNALVVIPDDLQIDSNITVGGQGGSLLDSVAFSATKTFDMNTTMNHLMLVTATTTLTVSNLISGYQYLVVALQDGTGGHTITLDSTFGTITDNSATMSITAGAYNFIWVWKVGSLVFHTIETEGN